MATLLSELIIMFILEYFPHLSSLVVALLDSVFLIVAISPILYFIVYRQLIKQLKEIKKAKEVMQDLALSDDLTGLYNRRGFIAFAAQLLKLSDRTKRGLVLIYIDVDKMKWINDSFGHAEGDEALKCTAAVLRESFRGSDIAGRIGGDEFVVLALEASSQNMDILRRRLRENIKNSRCCKILRSSISVSMGMVYYNPEKPCPIDELIRRADVMMYEEKRSSQGNGVV